MSDKELIAMIVDKIDTMKEDINSRLDKHEEGYTRIVEKLDAQTEKINSFEVRAETVLAVHDKDITQLKKEVDEMKAEKAKKESSPIAKFVNSDLATLLFRAIFLGLLGILTAFGTIKSDNAKKAMDLFTSNAPKTEIVKDTAK